MDIDESTSLTLPETANLSHLSLLPKKSRSLYEKTYSEFLSWCNEKQIMEYSESVLLEYFSNIVEKGLIASLWPKYSMLKSTLNLKDNIDISKFNGLTMFLKRQTEGHVPKKSKVLNKEHVQKFISDAPDSYFLMTKVALIFGVAGALRKHELLKLETGGVQDLGSKFLVTVKSSKTHTNRIFTIVDNQQNTLLNLVRRYISLRPAHTSHKRFFIYYRNDKCSVQPIGINTFSKLPSIIATFLKLEQPHLYTGHCFRRSSASILSDSGAASPAIEQLGSWKSIVVAEEYKESPYKSEINVQDAESDLAHSILADNTDTITVDATKEIDVAQSEVQPKLEMDEFELEPSGNKSFKSELEIFAQDPFNINNDKRFTDFNSPKDNSVPPREHTVLGDKQQEEDAYMISQDKMKNKKLRNRFQVFGKHVALKIESLHTENAQNTVEHLISNILFEASMGKYDNHFPTDTLRCNVSAFLPQGSYMSELSHPQPQTPSSPTSMYSSSESSFVYSESSFMFDSSPEGGRKDKTHEK